jgi:hypothetical protein
MSILMFLHFLVQLITGLHFDSTVVTPPPAVVAPAPVHHTQTQTPAPVETPAPTVTPPAVTQAPAPVENEEPTCQPGEEFQGEFGCVATQLPEETLGREY